ncbi:YqzH family protein [Neobacillus drentensis]|uniref:YqzH family protein n=1 Tax=Neobacillus drentensis TaxID=220684 RepID=UPI003000821A
MDKKLVVKMIKNCFKQYYKEDANPIGDKELEELTNRILQLKEDEPTADLYEVVNDTVYEFLTG